MSEQNLSEQLFKPKFNYPETSLISNSACPLPKLVNKSHALGYTRGWYRAVHRFWWIWQGGNLLDIDECLSAIASSKAERTRSECLDTVAVYGGGNWIFEFSKFAQERALKGRKLQEEGNFQKAAHQFRMSARYFSIASYPHLKGDVLAADAALLGRRSYREMCNCEKEYVYLDELKFKVGGSEAEGLLHLPDRVQTHPCLVLLTSYEMSATGFYASYKEQLQPYGIALLVLQMPGIGLSEKLTLNADQSQVLDAALSDLKDNPYVNASRIGLMGLRLGGSACIRTAIMHPEAVTVLCLIEPAVHSFFTNRNILDSLTLCMRSLYANRLNLDASNWDTVIPQLKQLSLKEQGLLGRGAQSAIPCFTASLNAFTTKDDLKLLQERFTNIECRSLDGGDYSDFMYESLRNSGEFLRKHLL